MEKYKIQKTIGSGSFANVSKALNTQTNETVAIKKMKKRFSTWEECLNLREIKSLTKLNHANIMKLKEVIRVNDELFCVFEFCEQNIYQFYLSYKERGQLIPEQKIREILYQTTCGIAYMHKHGFFHRDLKPENILYSKETVKIADFGLAREIRSRPPFTDYVATRWYRAPEIILKSTNYNSPVDIYALGCIIAELYLLNPLFSGSSELDQMQKICSVLGTPTNSSWSEGYRLAAQIGYSFPHYQAIPLNNVLINACSEAVQLVAMMLSFDPGKRPTAQQILQHPYLAGNIPLSIKENHKEKENFLKEKVNIHKEGDKNHREMKGDSGKYKANCEINENSTKKYENNSDSEEELMLSDTKLGIKNHDSDPFLVKKSGVFEELKHSEKEKTPEKFENKEVWRGENEVDFVSESRKRAISSEKFSLEPNNNQFLQSTKPFLVKNKELVVPFPEVYHSLYDEEHEIEENIKESNEIRSKNKSFHSQKEEKSDEEDEIKLEDQAFFPNSLKTPRNLAIKPANRYNNADLSGNLASLQRNERNLSLERREKNIFIAESKERTEKNSSLHENPGNFPSNSNMFFPKLKSNLNNLEENAANRIKNPEKTAGFLPEMTKISKLAKNQGNKEKAPMKLPNLPNGIGKNLQNINKYQGNTGVNMPSLGQKPVNSINLSYSPVKNLKDDENSYNNKYKL